MDAYPSRPTRLALAVTLAFSALLALPGCDRIIGHSAEEYIERAKDLQAEGDLKGGILELKNAVQKDPNSIQARFLLGNLYVSAKQGSAAEKELTKARELGIDKETIKVPLGEALLLTQDYKRLLEEIRPSEQTSVTNRAKILTLHGNAKLGLRQWDQACDLFGQALTLEKTHAPAHWGLAKCAVIEDKPDEARTHLDTAIKLDPNNPASWILLGDFERYSKNLDAAVKAYSAALKLAPNDIQGLAERANTYIFLNQPDLASEDIKRLRQLAPKHFTVYYLQALQGSRGSKTDEALSAVRKALQSNPNYPPALYLLGELQHRRGENEQAARTLGQYLRLLPGDRPARTLLARVRLSLNQPDQSLALIEPLLKANPTDTTLLSLAGQASQQTKQMAKAVDYLERAVAAEPKNAALRTQLGVALLAAGDAQRATAELEVGSELDVSHHRADITLIMAHLAKKEFDKALEAVDRLEQKLPKSPLPHNLRAAVYTGKNDLSHARNSLERALALQPGNVPAALNLAQLDLRERKVDSARKRLEGILDKDKGSLPAIMGLASVAEIQGRQSEYLDWLSMAAKAHPAALQPRVALVQYHLRQNEPRKALTVAREAQTANPNNPDALELLGQAQLAAGEKENALASFKNLVYLLPEAPTVRYRLAMVQNAVGQNAAALDSLRKALQLKPDYLEAQSALLSLLVRAGKDADALNVARQVQQQRPKQAVGFSLEGDALMAQRQFGLALKAYERAFAMAQDGFLAVKIHEAMSLSGRPQEAEGRLSQWVRQNPGAAEARLFLAGVYMRHGQNKAAIQHYEALVQQAPGNLLALNNLAWLYQQEKDPRARAMAEKAHQLKPQDPGIMDTLGWILVQEGATARGTELLRQAATAGPKIPSVQYHYAAALAKSGKKGQARKELEKLLASGQAFPEKEEAKALLKQL